MVDLQVLSRTVLSTTDFEIASYLKSKVRNTFKLPEKSDFSNNLDDFLIRKKSEFCPKGQILKVAAKQLDSMGLGGGYFSSRGNNNQF